MTRLSLGVIGAGRVGAVLASRLRSAGHPLVGVTGRSQASLLRIRTLLPGVDVMTPAAVAAVSDIVILAVPDDSLIAAAEELASSGSVRPGQYVLHTSGRHGLDALASLTRLGARPIAFHPAMTFTGTPVDLDRRCVFGLTAAMDDRPLAAELVTDLGGTPMWVEEADRALYHAALAHGANHLVTLVAQSMDLLRTAGSADPAAVLRPLLCAALDNVLAYGDAALTGPVVRGDVTTIRAHIDALAAADIDDSTVDAYLELARATAGRAEADGRLTHRGAGTIRQVLDEADWDAMAEIAAGI
ncbi:DUF2520 domain-containing protein [Aeromicrobium sp.]|uniref:Rossmann-like and DUF2520 domain-containing protein n=1 Tax=Aeromicrobium sp. TaxID=1871063 RepID=UPI0019977323|nr:DUF2520 domain-containing protein [Aeromicrobium sp.]MBC7633277.1 DUF2520 domain-containing protein [Aeromicrobium sp.]